MKHQVRKNINGVGMHAFFMLRYWNFHFHNFFGSTEELNVIWLIILLLKEKIGYS